MSFLWPAASRSLLRKCIPSGWTTLRSCTLRLEYSARNSSLCHGFSGRRTAFKKNSSPIAVATRAYASKTKRTSPKVQTSQGSGPSSRITPPSSQQIITRFEDLPDSYDDGLGLPFRSTDVSKSEVDSIFGANMVDVSNANSYLRILHGRRVAGTLEDPSMPLRAADTLLTNNALNWLRANVPVDEIESAGRRAEQELAAMEADILSDAEKLGLYKPNAGETSPKGNSFHPHSVYGESGLDEIRRVTERKRDAHDKVMEERRKQADEVRHNTGPLATQTVRERAQVELRRPGENPLLKKYLAAAAAVAPEVPQDMTAFQRLWPSALVTLLVIAGSVLFVQIYVPPSHSGRLWQDMPPAAATIISIISINSLVWLLWHTPPAFATLNKYFLSVPGYPRGLAILGNVFSHQAINHLALNMLMLWLIGTRLHDDIGRANFLAVYFSAGAFGSFASMAGMVLRRNFATHSLGASGAINGIVGCYLWYHAGEHFKVLGLPPDPHNGPPGWLILASLLSIELWSMFRTRKIGGNFDHGAHLGGMFFGVVAADIIYKRASRRRKAELERKRNMSVGEKLQSLVKR